MSDTAKYYDAPKVGGDTLSYCSRCKMELAHVVMAMVDNLPHRVICKTCKSEHKHRGAPGSRTASSWKKKAAKPKKTTMLASELWDQRMKESKSDTQNYSPKGEFKKGDVLSHPKFGMGHVEEVLAGKIQVLFRGGEKLLVHGLK